MQTSKLQNGILFIVLQFSSSYLFTYLVIYVVLSLYIFIYLFIIYFNIFSFVIFIWITYFCSFIYTLPYGHHAHCKSLNAPIMDVAGKNSSWLALRYFALSSLSFINLFYSICIFLFYYLPCGYLGHCKGIMLHESNLHNWPYGIFFFARFDLIY